MEQPTQHSAVNTQQSTLNNQHATALHWAWLHCALLHCTALHCTALYCTALYCTAMQCNVLHCTAIFCTRLHCTKLFLTVLHYTALQCTTLHCNALKFTAMLCRTTFDVPSFVDWRNIADILGNVNWWLTKWWILLSGEIIPGGCSTIQATCLVLYRTLASVDCPGFNQSFQLTLGRQRPL